MIAVACWSMRPIPEITITLMPLRGGDAVWIDAPGRQDDVLVDCGSLYSFKNVTEPFLHAQGVNRIPRFAITHGDVQHIGGASNLIAQFRPAALNRGPAHERSAIYRQLTRLDVDWQIVAAGNKLGRFCEVLHPSAGQNFPDADDNAVVSLATFGGIRVLFLSDLGRAGQESLLTGSASVRADIVVTGLPARGEALHETLLKEIDPQLIIVLDSERPATARAKKTLRARLDAQEIPVFYGHRAGTITVVCDNQAWRVRGMNGGVYSGRHRE